MIGENITFFAGTRLSARFGVSAIGADFPVGGVLLFELLVDFRTALLGRTGGLSFLCGFIASFTVEPSNKTVS